MSSALNVNSGHIQKKLKKHRQYNCGTMQVSDLKYIYIKKRIKAGRFLDWDPLRGDLYYDFWLILTLSFHTCCARGFWDRTDNYEETLRPL